MARRRRRSRRSYSDMVKIPGLGSLNKSVNTTDVAVGIAAGIGGTLLLKVLGNTMLAGKVPDFVLKGSPLVGCALSGGALYFAKRKNKAKANAYLFGALAAGASIQAWDVAKTTYPESLGDVVSLKLGRYGRYGRYGGKYGVFVDEKTPAVGPGGYGGLIVNDGNRQLSEANLGQLANLSMAGGESSGMEELMELE